MTAIPSQKEVEARVGMESEPKMNDFSDDLLISIFLRLKWRNHVSLVCRRWYELDRVVTRELYITRRWNEPERALTALLSRFCNVTKVEISYLMCKSGMRKEVDDYCLRSLSLGCVNLTDLSLEECSHITDFGIASIAVCRTLLAIRLTALPCVSGRGLLSLVSGCPSLSLLHVDWMDSLRDMEWLEFIGTHRQIESLSIRNCGEVQESELAKLGPRGWKNLREIVYEADPRFFWQPERSPSQLRSWRFPYPEGTEYCPNLEVLSFRDSFAVSTTGLLWILAQCRSLRWVRIDGCVGLEDADINRFTRNNPQITTLSLRIDCGLSPKLTNASLVDIAGNCRCLETLKLMFVRRELTRTFDEPKFMESGIVAILEGCTRLKSLRLQHIPFLRERTMAAIGRSKSLISVEFVDCKHLNDEMILLLGSNLTELSFVACPLLTDECLNKFRTPDGIL